MFVTVLEMKVTKLLQRKLSCPSHIPMAITKPVTFIISFPRHWPQLEVSLGEYWNHIRGLKMSLSWFNTTTVNNACRMLQAHPEGRTECLITQEFYVVSELIYSWSGNAHSLYLRMPGYLGFDSGPWQLERDIYDVVLKSETNGWYPKLAYLLMTCI